MTPTAGEIDSLLRVFTRDQAAGIIDAMRRRRSSDSLLGPRGLE